MIKVDSKVRFIENEISKHYRKELPFFYPPFGTIGIVTEIEEHGFGEKVLKVQWEEGSTSDNDCWWTFESLTEEVTE